MKSSYVFTGILEMEQWAYIEQVVTVVVYVGKI